MSCQELTSLLERYTAASTAYNNFLLKMTHLPDDALDGAREHARVLREAADRTAQELMKHRDEHRC